ncbi:MAG: exo-alpha-sialidase [Chloroflexi bacterium]|nr:MAG: exo-alpha-sialidase [Chloroflexota bacterium]
MRRVGSAFALATGAFVALASTALASTVPLQQISSDPFTNTTSLHKTQEEPDTFAFGSTIVSTFQVGRFRNGGASDIGFATSQNGGRTWTHGSLPGLTFQVDPSSPYERVSDASVAFDAKHNVWMISSIPLLPNRFVPTVFVSRSTDGGLTWGNPISIVPLNSGDFDKNWSVCDNSPTSPFYGSCYTEFDNFAKADLELMTTSRDGGLTWGPAMSAGNSAKGLGGQPLVQPNGTVIVPFETIHGTIAAFRSTDGGASWDNAVLVAHINFHSVAGNLRTSPLPTAEIDGSGIVYVAWEDCSFEPGCAANDIVFSSSADGVNWSGLSRVPADPVGSGVDHFIPGLGVDQATSGSRAHLGLSYYYYPNAACTVSTCELDAAFISSANAGVTWSRKQSLAGPMNLTWLPLTTQGYMVGDYISTSFIGGAAFTTIAVASTGTAPQNLNEAIFANVSGLRVVGGGSGSDHAASSDSSNIATAPAPINR